MIREPGHFRELGHRPRYRLPPGAAGARLRQLSIDHLTLERGLRVTGKASPAVELVATTVGEVIAVTCPAAGARNRARAQLLLSALAGAHGRTLRLLASDDLRRSPPAFARERDAIANGEILVGDLELWPSPARTTGYTL